MSVKRSSSPQQLGRFTVSNMSSLFNDTFDETVERQFKLDLFDRTDEDIIDSLIVLVEQNPSSVKQIISSNQQLFNRLFDLNESLVSFSDSVQPFLHLFNDTNMLKLNIMTYYVASTQRTHINSSITLLPLSIQFAYSKYSTSLLTLKPHNHLVIDYEDFKRFINHFCC